MAVSPPPYTTTRRPSRGGLLALHAAQHRHRVEDARGAARRDVGALAQVRTDGDEGGVEAPVAHRGLEVVHPAVEVQLDAHGEDPPDLGVEHVARQPVGRDAEAHHPAGARPGVVDRHRVAEQRQVIGGRQARGAGADDEDALARAGRRRRDRPAAPDRLVAEEALDGVDPDGLVELAAVARRLARVVADAAHDRRQRVGLHDLAPATLVAALLGVVQPGLDVLPGRARVAAGRDALDVDGPLGAPRAGLVRTARADVQRDREGLLAHGASPKRAMLRSARAWMRAMRSGRGSGLKRCA